MICKQYKEMETGTYQTLDIYKSVKISAHAFENEHSLYTLHLPKLVRSKREYMIHVSV